MWKMAKSLVPLQLFHYLFFIFLLLVLILENKEEKGIEGTILWIFSTPEASVSRHKSKITQSFEILINYSFIEWECKVTLKEKAGSRQEQDTIVFQLIVLIH